MDLLFARWQMAISLGFHIIFACIGMIMPFLMLTAHYKWLKTKEPLYLNLTKAWSRGVAILFAIGAVSGTVLSFELGLLWPQFMEHAGPIIGMPFSLEGTAFFLEGIALGFYLYGWNKINPWLHWLSGWVVGISGIASGIFVVSANGWMNSPSGFDWVNGVAINIDPIQAFFNKAWFPQAHHMIVASVVSVGFAVAGIHAYGLLKKPHHHLHKAALIIALWFGSAGAFLQLVSGDHISKHVAHHQPLKLAAAEGLFDTQEGAPLSIGGWPNMEERKLQYAVEIPKMLSFLSFNDVNAEVKGLNAFPREEWPPVPVVHIAFQMMVAIGIFLVTVSCFFVYSFFFKRGLLFHRLFLKVLVACSPLGFIAVEAGWTVTEVGRQPWIIYGIMKTKDALTPMPGLIAPFILITFIYLFLSIVVSWLMYRQFRLLSDQDS